MMVLVTVVGTVILLGLIGGVGGWRFFQHLHRDQDQRVRAAALQAAQEIAGITLSAREEIHRIVAEDQARRKNA